MSGMWVLEHSIVAVRLT